MTNPSDYGYAAPKFETRIAQSIFEEFVLDHTPADVLRELVQNEYDAGGTKLEVRFDQHEMTIRGNGMPIDQAGWQRLSVLMGTGKVAGGNDFIQAFALR